MTLDTCQTLEEYEYSWLKKNSFANGTLFCSSLFAQKYLPFLESIIYQFMIVEQTIWFFKCFQNNALFELMTIYVFTSKITRNRWDDAIFLLFTLQLNATKLLLSFENRFMLQLVKSMLTQGCKTTMLKMAIFMFLC